jgi:hypothetical protein
VEELLSTIDTTGCQPHVVIYWQATS